MPQNPDQLKALAKAYKDAYTQAGGDPQQVADEQALVKKMEGRGVQTPDQARQAGQQDGAQAKGGTAPPSGSKPA
jgi:hypothetical protein